MKFVDNDTFLEVSELTTKQTVSISMGQPQNEEYANYMELDKDDLVRLRDFFNEAISQIE